MFAWLRSLFRRRPSERDLALWGPWLLELDGVPVVRLSEGRLPDQFSREFYADIITEDEALRTRLADEALWVGNDLKLRSLVTGEFAEGWLFALASAQRLASDGIVSIRGL